MNENRQLTTEQALALDRIRKDERLIEYELELMTDVMGLDSQEWWEYVATADTDELLKLARVTRDEMTILQNLYVTVAQASRKYGIPRPTLTWAIRRQRLAATKLDGRWYMDDQDVRTWAENEYKPHNR